jgi:hypothetical protein
VLTSSTPGMVLQLAPELTLRRKNSCKRHPPRCIRTSQDANFDRLEALWKVGKILGYQILGLI